jgi:hypothetical protein
MKPVIERIDISRDELKELLERARALLPRRITGS